MEFIDEACNQFTFTGGCQFLLLAVLSLLFSLICWMTSLVQPPSGCQTSFGGVHDSTGSTGISVLLGGGCGGALVGFGGIRQLLGSG